MTTKEFLIAKNAIVKRATNLVLIPEDQIVDEPYVELIISSGLTNINCPYCMSRINTDGTTIDCTTCPMALADNKCEEYGSTWYKAHLRWKWFGGADESARNELLNLIIEYNDANKGK